MSSSINNIMHYRNEKNNDVKCHDKHTLYFPAVTIYKLHTYNMHDLTLYPLLSTGSTQEDPS